MDHYETAVARGIQFLDEVAPGWFHKVDMERLDITYADCCVLGQVFRTSESGFWQTFDLTVEKYRGEESVEAWAGGRGFDANGLLDIPLTEQFERLNLIWRREIVARQDLALFAKRQ